MADMRRVGPGAADSSMHDSGIAAPESERTRGTTSRLEKGTPHGGQAGPIIAR